MYILHYAPDNASLILRLVMDDADIPFTTQLVNRATRQQDSAPYRALNPTGLIPTLVTPAGPISETAACLLWLAEAHPAANLAPPAGHSDRTPFLKWLFFLSNAAHADLRQIFYPDQYVGPEGEHSHAEKLTARMIRHFGLLNQAAQTHPALFASPCVLAYYTATLMRWPMLYPKTALRWFKIADFPALHAMANALETRPATQTAMAAEGLGPTPFTHPHPPCPPEGSAL
ncbi:glutathione S-transferase family protein [Pseudorhodobacter ferrugineus]|uniref:glutathione S-transferase family protein n=1 Tax=Pseudorhodobacter ferrugineus TaxID=77008 RepID=UPI0004120614|nr:glutathione S-transferase family protein [Pseudorhodobacter ferrugineus]